MPDNYFEDLYQLDVNDKVEKKNGLSYLSWAWAWAETKKRFPDASYEIERFENNLPYVFDPETGYMVFTKVTIGNVTHEMWLPVMDSSNKAMKDKPYTYVTGWGNNKKERTVDAADMFDVNKTIMRCLTKNLAMFGLGLYIYAGEDLPEEAKEEQVKIEIAKQEQDKDLKEAIAKVVKTGTALIKSGVSKDSIAEAVALYNDGEGNPKTIKDIKSCEDILNEFAKLKGGK